LKTRQERERVQLLDLVGAGVEGPQAEAFAQLVIVLEFFDVIVMQVEPLQVLWNERVVEPLQSVGRDVEPTEFGLACQNPVDVFQLILIEPEHSQLGDGVEHSLLQVGQAIVGQVECLEIGDGRKDGGVKLLDSVAGKTEAVEVGKAVEGVVGEVDDQVVTDVEGLEFSQGPDGLGNEGQKISGEAEIDESGAAVLQNLFVKIGQPVSFEGEGTEDAEAGQRLRMEAVDDVVRQSEDVEVVLREEAVAGDGVKTVVAQVEDLERGQAREDAALESVESVVRQVESDESHATGKGVRSQPVVADVVPRQVEDE